MQDELAYNKEYHYAMDSIEAIMDELGDAEDFPVSGFFCGGMYIRSIFIPAGSYLSSKIHRYEHTFAIMQGTIVIFTEDGGKEVLTAPYLGITKPGTRRLGFAETDTVWVTHHRVEGKTEQEVEDEIIISREEHLKLMEG